MWNVIARKELKDALRDRRALLSLLIFPVLGPVMVYFMFTRIVDLSGDLEAVSLPVVGSEFAGDLIDYLEQAGVQIENLLPYAGTNDSQVIYDQQMLDRIEAAIASRRADYVLLIPEDFEQRVSQSRPVNLELHHESSRTAAAPKVERVQQLIESWGRENAMLRLIARGISPQITSVVNVQRIDIASAQARARQVLAMIPLFVIMAAFICGMGLAVDATAGERERKSLEPLLVNPVSRMNIVLGKWFAAVLFSASGLVVVMVLNLFALSQVPLDQVGLVFNIGRLEIIGILITTLPLAFFATSIQIFIGIFAKSFKDAQAYLSLIMMLPMAPYFFNMFNTQDRELWMSFVPMLGQHMLLADVVSAKTPEILDFAIAGLAVFLCSLLFIYGASELLKRERIIFS
ncbi:MAG: ABC transporter permease [Pseudohongiellaceae bacterium]